MFDVFELSSCFVCQQCQSDHILFNNMIHHFACLFQHSLVVIQQSAHVCKMLEISSHQMLQSVCAVESAHSVCLHDSFINQLQLLLMLLSHVSSFILDHYCISQVFLTDFWSIINSDFSLRFRLTVIVIRFKHVYNKITKQVNILN